VRRRDCISNTVDLKMMRKDAGTISHPLRGVLFARDPLIICAMQIKANAAQPRLMRKQQLLVINSCFAVIIS